MTERRRGRFITPFHNMQNVLHTSAPWDNVRWKMTQCHIIALKKIQNSDIPLWSDCALRWISGFVNNLYIHFISLFLFNSYDCIVQAAICKFHQCGINTVKAFILYFKQAQVSHWLSMNKLKHHIVIITLKSVISLLKKGWKTSSRGLDIILNYLWCNSNKFECVIKKKPKISRA